MEWKIHKNIRKVRQKNKYNEIKLKENTITQKKHIYNILCTQKNKKLYFIIQTFSDKNYRIKSHKSLININV